ncbi:MAG: hypothetical protein U1A72_23170 [Sulfuritalea sp.]|nr:hypothetical protein [Sulfuritalea sp.]
MATAGAKPYRGKYPNRIKEMGTATDSRGREFYIVTNAGARFVFSLLHPAAPMPTIGAEVEDWLLFVTPTNDGGKALAKMLLDA